jgi:hypothetical protein
MIEKKNLRLAVTLKYVIIRRDVATLESRPFCTTNHIYHYSKKYYTLSGVSNINLRRSSRTYGQHLNVFTGGSLSPILKSMRFVLL